MTLTYMILIVKQSMRFALLDVGRKQSLSAVCPNVNALM